MQVTVQAMPTDRRHVTAPARPDNMGMASALRSVIAAAETHGDRENEYLGDDGLLHCKTCGDAVQTWVQLPFADEPRKVRCVCRCVKAAEDRQRERDRRDMIERRRRLCFEGNEAMTDWNFNNDDQNRPELTAAAMKYAENFREYRRDGRGLLFWGPVGTGKTYLAASIANKVIEMGYTARLTNFAKVSDALQSTWEKDEYIKDLLDHDLLIFDDLGAERKSEYMQEMVFKIIDARYCDGRPMIITTNLTSDELAKPGEIGYSRIYDRVLERCLPVKVDGHSRRRQYAKRDWNEMRRALGMEVHT